MPRHDMIVIGASAGAVEALITLVGSLYRDHFFERADNGYRVTKTLRQMVIFGQQDLTRSAPFPRIDLILCRNVLIYFTPELQDYVLTHASGACDSW